VVSSIEDLVVYHELEFSNGEFQQEVKQLTEEDRQELARYFIRPAPQLADDEAYTVSCIDSPLAEEDGHPLSAEDGLAQPSEVSQRGPASRPAPPALLSFASAWHRDAKHRTPCASPSVSRLKELTGAAWIHFAASHYGQLACVAPTNRRATAGMPAIARPDQTRRKPSDQ